MSGTSSTRPAPAATTACGWPTWATDLKGNELPTELFLTYAWNPDHWTFGRLAGRERRYARQNFQDAWFELVGYEVTATANLYALRTAEFTDLLYARQGRAAINSLAAQAEQAL